MLSGSEEVKAAKSPRIRAGGRLSLTVLLFSLATHSHTQEPASPPSVTFSTNANLVVLDAVVKDRNGKPVTNLTRDDFTVLEDGVVQTIASFESASSQGTPVPAVDNGKSSDERKASAPVSPQALTILVLDELNSEVFDQAYGRNAIEKFLSKHGPRLEQPTSLMLLGQKRIELLHDYTQDARALTPSCPLV
jgi:VWFA-related protein